MSDKSDNWGIIGGIAIGICVVLAIGAYLAYYYQTVINLGSFGQIPRYPYREYVVPLIIGSVLSLVIGIGSGIGSYAASENSEHKPIRQTLILTQNTGLINRFCSNCGQQNPQGASFCNYCGKNLFSKDTSTSTPIDLKKAKAVDIVGKELQTKEKSIKQQTTYSLKFKKELKGKRKILAGIGFIILIFGSTVYASAMSIQVPFQVQVPYGKQVAYQEYETRTQLLDHRENYQITTAASSNFELEAGKTLVTTWKTDGSVAVYILNPSQYSVFKFIGFLGSSLMSKTFTSSDSLSYPITEAGKYYVVINNLFFDKVNVTSYKSELQWQEAVTKYKTETEYRAEIQYRPDNAKANIGAITSVLGVTIIAVSFTNIKRKKNPEPNVNKRLT